jgi:hypothetical protein
MPDKRKNGSRHAACSSPIPFFLTWPRNLKHSGDLSPPLLKKAMGLDEFVRKANEIKANLIMFGALYQNPQVIN